MSREQERSELHKTIWAIANDLRGSVDGWDFKTYVLGMLFYRFISESLTEYLNNGERKAGNIEFDYEKLSDADAEFGRCDTIVEKGFYILPSQLFSNVLANAKNNPNLNETLSQTFNNIENSAKGTASEDNVKSLFDDLDVNSPKLGNDVPERNRKLAKIMNSIANLNLGNYNNKNIDIIGDAYEFLITMYASNAGKSGGEFFTPQEVSELLAKLTINGQKEINKVYDPACGSGGLLLKFAKILGKDNIKNGFFGQEINITAYNMCRINMFLHEIDYNKFSIARGDTLLDPYHWDDEPFDAIVSNPPYGIKWAGDSDPLLINDPRYSPAGVLAPKSNADFAFTMHMLKWLSQKGTAAIVEFPGVLYRGGAEQKIRKYLVDNNFVDCIIQLPSNLFFGTSIATCIIVLKKSTRFGSDIQFIDASEEFVKSGNKSKLSEENIKRIMEAFTNKNEIEYFSKLIPYQKIVDNDYNLSVSTYLEKENLNKEVNIKVLNQEIKDIVVRQDKIRTELDSIIRFIGVDYE